MKKENYNELKKKYALPEFELLDTLFEISTIDKDTFLLRLIRRKISDHIQQYSAFLEGLLNPGTTVSALHESRFLTEQNKKDIADLYTQLMILNRTALQAELSKDEKQDAVFIIAVFKAWPLLSKKLATLLETVKATWQQEEPADIQQTYFM